MAQHIDASRIDDTRIQRIVEGIRKQKYYRTSMRYETVDTNIYATHRRVPESIVAGGRATFEVHTNDRGIAERIYLVA